MLSAASLSTGSQLSRRDAERELLAVGAEFEQALTSYAGASGNAGRAIGELGPQTLEELLKDPRFPGMMRHLRQIYTDPLTGRSEWGLVKAPGGFIVGVYSLAEGIPIQRNGLEPAQVGFENAQSYADWVFGLPIASWPNNYRSSTAIEPATSKF
jgi:type II secretory pathway pseudopilin PulG